MTHLSDYLERQLQDWAFDDTFMPSPVSTVYVALHTAKPGTDGDGSNEVGASDYARVGVAAGDWSRTTDGTNVVTNDIAIVFPEAQTSWGTITHLTIWDGSASSDNVLFWGPLDENVDINAGETYEIRAGDLSVTPR